MAGRGHRRRGRDEEPRQTRGAPVQDRAERLENGCWLCRRPLGDRVQWHHFIPRSRGGRATVPVHPICHSALHSAFTNTELAAFGEDVETLRRQAPLETFLRWIDGKPPDFHAPTRKRKT